MKEFHPLDFSRGMESRRLPGGVAVDELHDQWHVVAQHLVGGRSVGPGEVEGVGVVLEEEGFVVDHRVARAEDTPDAVAIGGGVVVPLVQLQLGKLVDEGLVDDEVLVAVSTRGLVFVGPETRGEEEGHLEVGVTQQRGQSQARGHHLDQECAVAVAHNCGGMVLQA